MVRFSAMTYCSSCFRLASSSLWALASISRRRIFSAPDTASAATWSRSSSLARCITETASFSAAVRACSTMRATSARASSMSLAACFSAAARTSPADSRALRISSTAFFSASSRSVLALSAAASPSAIFAARSSSAFMIGGHTNFIVNQPRMKNTTIWAIRVAFRFTVLDPRWVLRRWRSGDERVGEGEHHRDTDTDQERGVDQTGQQEHLGLQGVHQLRLTGRGFEVFAAHDADADASTDGAHTDDQASSQRDVTEGDFHDNSLRR